jgi:urease accessory protein
MMYRRPLFGLTTMPVLSALFLVILTTAVEAHTGTGVIGGFASGLLHPIFGWDHVVAMVAVGRWGSFLGNPAYWLLPVVFPLVVAVGGAFGVLGVALPAVETGIALSGVVLGLAVLFAIRAPLWVAAIIVGVFAIFHGHAHGAELPEAANPFAFAVGFMIGTGLLHMAGIGLGLLSRLPKGSYLVRGLGAAISLVGGAFLFGLA